MALRARCYAWTAIGDAQALPLCDDAVDVALCMHVLYHVANIEQAVRELRRVVRQGGQVLVSTNDAGHAAEAKQILARAARRIAGIDVDRDWDTRRFPTSRARDLLAPAFDQIDVRERCESFPVSEPMIVSRYIASWPPESIGLQAGPVWNAILGETAALVAAHFAQHGTFVITSRVAILRCR